MDDPNWKKHIACVVSIFLFAIVSFFSGFYTSERGHTVRTDKLRTSNQQLSSQNKELTTSLDQLTESIGELREAIERKDKQLAKLYQGIGNGIDDSQDLASGANRDLEDAKEAIGRIRKLLDNSGDN